MVRSIHVHRFVGCVSIAMAMVAGCQPSGNMGAPATRSLVGEAETLAGRRAAVGLEERFGGTVANGAAIERMRAVERRLVRGTPELRRPWQYHVLASDKINAFSLPGGLIYVTRGLYERRIGEDNDLLAAALAHEMAHVVRKDSLKPASSASGEGLAREISADGCAVRYLRAAGYDQTCLRDLLRLIEDAQPPDWLRARLQALGAGTTKSHRG